MYTHDFPYSIMNAGKFINLDTLLIDESLDP